MTQFGVSQPVRRTEDVRFVTGRGRFVDDIDAPGQAHGVVVRAPHAHALIRMIDVSAAAAAPGVVAVITGAELDEAGANALPCLAPVGNSIDVPRPVLCTKRVCHVGDAVAFVVADTLAHAKDAAELVAVDYRPLAAVVDTATAHARGQPQIHDRAKGNLCFDWRHGDARSVKKAFSAAAHVVGLDIVNNRLIGHAMETRGALAEPGPGKDRMTLTVCTQGGWLVRDVIAESVLKVAPESLRVITPDVGGGFGIKIFPYPEYALAAWAARKLARPVKWVAERGESFLADTMGRDNVSRAELALDAEARILALRVDTTANLGAYLSTFAPFIPTLAHLKVSPGVYDVPALHLRVRGVFTNTTPVDAYRGAGRPEAIYLIERLIDCAARELGIDPAEIRRRNFVPAAAMPFRTVAGETYDSGEFETVMDRALAKADRAGFALRRRESEAQGLRRGLGICCYIESTMGDAQERAAIRFTDQDTVEVVVGTQSTGQGHETAFAQVLHERLGVPFAAIRILQGDTDLLAGGGGTGGSRSLTAEGWAIGDAADKVIERGKHYAAQLLEAAVADIDFADARFGIVGTDRAIAVMDLARAARAMDAPRAGLEGGLDAEATARIGAYNYPNGCHVAEVEVDPETGMVTVARYTVVDDFGRVLNPLLVAGQVHGGVAQGIGQALFEHALYEPGGQLVTGSTMDYALPRADVLPAFDVSFHEVPCANNPLGVKGCGEAGSIAAPPTVINAVIDALWDLGVRHIDMPATPERVWRAIRQAR